MSAKLDQRTPKLRFHMRGPWAYEKDVSDGCDPPWVRTFFTTSVAAIDEDGRRWLHPEAFDCDARGVVGDPQQAREAFVLLSTLRADKAQPGDGWYQKWYEIDPVYGSAAYQYLGIEATRAQLERYDAKWAEGWG